MTNLWIKLTLTMSGALLISACSSMQPAAPEVSFDGLQLKPDSRFATVYEKPGVDFSTYQKFIVADCEVAFRKNWQRDQNQDRVDLSNRVTQEDVERIKTRLGANCQEKFREELAKDPAYPLVEETTQGEGVLILRPSIIDLDINAPDVRTTGISRTFTTSAGEMTLYLEILDGTTNEILARIIDRHKDLDDGYLTWTNSVTNTAEADRILSRWAKQLRTGLDKVRAGSRG